MLMTWGPQDFIGDNGESDGKWSLSLNFPNEEYRKVATDEFLKKNKDFENFILDSAVTNSELWWGEEMSREVCKHTFFPYLKYSKNKDTKKIDPSKPPSIKAKVPFYDNKWGIEIYDTKEQLVFPSDDKDKLHLTPIDFIPKLSQVACVLQCGGIWIGGKGWGLTWKVIQCVVKPREIVSVYGKCHIQLSSDDREAIESQKIPDEDLDDEVEEPSAKPATKPATVFDTSAADSDEEEAEPIATPAPVVKKVVKKAPAPVEVETPVEEPSAVAVEEAPKKKVVKKKVV
jgi:hypothetical protein